MRTVILVPRRAHPERDKLWEWCKVRWQRYHPTLQIYEGHHEGGPFNRSAAINTASRLADADGPWDYAIIIDADIFLRASQVRDAVKRAQKTGRVTWAHTRWRGLNSEWTKKIVGRGRDMGAEIRDVDMDVLVEKTNPISWSCCIVVPRKVWDAIGGFDERFVGWGFEDHAFRAVVCGLYGWERLKGDVYHLFHERFYGAGRASKAGTDYTAEAITNARLGRRYMIAVLRDYGIGDQVGQEHLTAQEAAVHIANLKKDDERLSEHAKGLRLPDWSEWWPTLEELNEGAKAARQLAGSVTVVVHTGGASETWPERSAYLRRSLASLNEQIHGPIVQRVIYSDWPDEHRDELARIAADAGFYVVGEGHHGYTGSMRRMWTYLSKRAQGEYIFATEDDFIYPEPVDLEPMILTLRDNPHLAQLALLRDAFYQDEKETGGILGWPEPAFTLVGQNGTSRLEHRLFFTCNPSLFRKSLTARPWPIGKHSETLFGKQLLNDRRLRFAFWGNRVELTKHIGETRAGTGY